MKLQKHYQYAIFRTQWGWFGMLGSEQGLTHTYLPVARKEAVQSRILSDVPDAEQSKKAFSLPQKAVEDYYNGSPVDFGNVDVRLDGFSDFQQTVLSTLQTITYGQIVSYGQLAQLAGNPNAARAIGTVMARNPLPLVIPCHRVIKADGTPGQFSAGGGINTKTRMLELEKSNRRK